MVLRPIINTLTTTPLKAYADTDAISVGEDSAKNLPETTNQQGTASGAPANKNFETLSAETNNVISDKPDEAVNVLRNWIDGVS